EQFMHDAYEALRSGAGWAKTLLVITYDEHGGCYDHVPPPAGATPPDNSAGEFGFDFTRFGVRVPAVLVSPLIPAGTVFRAPAGSIPAAGGGIHVCAARALRRRYRGTPAAAGAGRITLALANPGTGGHAGGEFGVDLARRFLEPGQELLLQRPHGHAGRVG